MLVKIKGSALAGINAITITVAVNVSMGQGYTLVGLPDSSVKESLHRTESAIKANGLFMPRTKLLVNLAPADIKKTAFPTALFIPPQCLDTTIPNIPPMNACTAVAKLKRRFIGLSTMAEV